MGECSRVVQVQECGDAPRLPQPLVHAELPVLDRVQALHLRRGIERDDTPFPSNITRDGPPVTRGLSSLSFQYYKGWPSNYKGWPSLPSNITRAATCRRCTRRSDRARTSAAPVLVLVRWHCSGGRPRPSRSPPTASSSRRSCACCTAAAARGVARGIWRSWSPCSSRTGSGRRRALPCPRRTPSCSSSGAAERGLREWFRTDFRPPFLLPWATGCS